MKLLVPLVPLVPVVLVDAEVVRGVDSSHERRGIQETERKLVQGRRQARLYLSRAISKYGIWVRSFL